MLHATVRRMVIVCGVAVLGTSMPAETQACRFFDCLFGRSQTTYVPPYAPSYAPAYAPQSYAPAYNSGCAPCQPQTCQPQVCQYVPQTCYRTVYQQVPVTTQRAVTRCNPLTGCPTTCYYPMTTWTRQARRVPYTTYRLVYSNPCNTCGGYGSYSGGVSTVSSGAASCGCGTGTTTPAPYDGPAEAAPQGTFRDTERKATEDEPLQAVPNTNLNSTMPGLNGPANRTTARPVRQASYYRLISTVPPKDTSRTTPVNDGGWRASSD